MDSMNLESAEVEVKAEDDVSPQAKIHPVENQTNLVDSYLISADTDNTKTKKRVRPLGCKQTQKKGRDKLSKSIAPFEVEGPLSREDVKCPICVSIFIEPVTFPCKHTLCLDCYRNSVEKSSLYCPICRLRLSVWSRNASKENDLVNKPFWERIKAEYGREVEARLEGEDSQGVFSNSPNKPLIRDGFVAQEGEIRQEFDCILKQHAEDLENEKKKEAEASSELIRQLQEEEGLPLPPESPSQVLRDFELAKKLQEEEQRERNQQAKVRSANSGRNQSQPVSRPHSSRPHSSKRANGHSSSTPFSQSSKRICTTEVRSKQQKISSFFEPTVLASSRSNTPDSINAEINQHFQPIAPAPKTPPKKNADGTVEASVFVASKPFRRDLSLEFDLLVPASTATTPEEVQPNEQAQYPGLVADEEPISSISLEFDLFVPPSVPNSPERSIQYPGLVLDEESEILESPRRAISPIPSDLESEAGSSEFLFNLSIEDRVENARAQALLEQEEEDRKFALKLQRELNKPTVVEREMYELRESISMRKNRRAPAADPNKPSTSTQGKP